MTLSIHLPQPMEQALNRYCASHAISQGQVIEQALEQFLSAQDQPPNAYELGQAGFGADETHAGDIARNSKQLLSHLGRARLFTPHTHQFNGICSGIKGMPLRWEACFD